MARQIHFCTTPEGVRLAYTVFGSGPVIVAPPPWLSHLALEREHPRIRSFWKKLASRHTVVRYDKQGCGLSDRRRNDFSLQKEVRDLEAIVDHLKLTAFALFGFSQAGPVVITYSSMHPHHVTHLILYGTFAQGETTFSPRIRAYVLFLIQTVWGFGSKTLSEIFIPDADPNLHSFFIRFQREAATAEMAAKLLEAQNEWDVTELLSKIAVPTLILHRKSDRVVPLSAGVALAESIPRSAFFVLNGKDHMPALGDAETILGIVNEFLGTEDILEINSVYDYGRLINF